MYSAYWCDGSQDQMTFVAPSAAKMSWICRHAAMKTDGCVQGRPQGYHQPFISWPKESTTWHPKALTALA